jgi:hypothetical protein
MLSSCGVTLLTGQHDIPRSQIPHSLSTGLSFRTVSPSCTFPLSPIFHPNAINPIRTWAQIPHTLFWSFSSCSLQASHMMTVPTTIAERINGHFHESHKAKPTTMFAAT